MIVHVQKPKAKKEWEIRENFSRERPEKSWKEEVIGCLKEESCEDCEYTKMGHAFKREIAKRQRAREKSNAHHPTYTKRDILNALDQLPEEDDDMNDEENSI